ncbi:hypothetical protein N7530_002540 [Penicillium desertorum]|uniref:Uncharacterized protein n=1 Tax=Penicillium desertorum TaxID=1303715 RepID=A0A9X0BTN2_9EURO|nr:hypothetical protein N7530_002540 [Penicillium desertorum]
MIRKLVMMESVPAHLLYIFVFALTTGLFGDYWSGVHDHPLLLEPLQSIHKTRHRRAIYPGKLVAGPERFYQTADTARAGQSGVCLAWEVFTWLPQEAGWKSTRAWWALVTLYRAIVIASFALFTACQAQYLPLPLGSCANAYEWRSTVDVPKGTPTIWEVLPLSSTRTRKGTKAMIVPCAVLNRLRVFEFVAIGLLAISMLESMAIFIWFSSVSYEMPEPFPWLQRLNNVVLTPFLALTGMYHRLRSQKKTGGDPEREMQPLARPTGNQESKYSSGWDSTEEEDGISVSPMPAEWEDGIRVRPMSDSANEGRPNHLES